MNKYRYSHTSRKLKFEFLKNSSLQTFSLRQTEGEHRIIYPPTSPSAHKVIIGLLCFEGREGREGRHS